MSLFGTDQKYSFQFGGFQPVTRDERFAGFGFGSGMGSGPGNAVQGFGQPQSTIADGNAKSQGPLQGLMSNFVDNAAIMAGAPFSIRTYDEKAESPAGPAKYDGDALRKARINALKLARYSRGPARMARMDEYRTARHLQQTNLDKGTRNSTASAEIRKEWGSDWEQTKPEIV